MSSSVERCLAPEDRPEALARDVAAIAGIEAVPSILQIVCRNTGMGFAAVARVTDGTWTACAVHDEIGFGLLPGGQLDLHSTLCKEVRVAMEPIAFDQASAHPLYKDHHTPRTYGIESYISVPIVLGGGEYFGNLCAIDPRPAAVSTPEVVDSFTSFAQLIAVEIERGRREESLRAELSSAQATALLRDQFIAILGHDLRSPLQTVSTVAELMVSKPQAVDVSVLGRRLLNSTSRMTGLISDVLDFARIRLGGGMTLRLQEDEGLAAALADVVHEARISHPSRQFVDVFAIPGSTAYDKGRLQQLLSNLVSNAVHHGDRDSRIEIDGSIVDSMLTITVANRGQRISPAHLDKIFEPYWRPPTSSAGGGLGLGLHICQQIANAHGGWMQVSSEDDGWTRFHAHLPLSATQ